MPVDFVCQCGERVTISDKLLGRWIKCKKCGREFQAPKPRRGAKKAAAPSHRPSRYDALADRRPNPLGGPFLFGGAIAGAVLILVVAGIMLHGGEDAEELAPAPVATTTTPPIPMTPASAASLAPTDGAPDATAKPGDDAAPADPSAAPPTTGDAAPPPPAPTATKPIVATGVATKVQDAPVEPGPLHAGPFDLDVTSIQVVDRHTCDSPLVAQIIGKPLELAPTREGYKLAVLSLRVSSTRAYSDAERAAVGAIALIRDGARKIEDAELALTTDHLRLAHLPAGTTQRVAMPAMIVYPDRGTPGYALGGEAGQMYLRAAVFTRATLDVVAVFEFDPSDSHVLLIATPVPGLESIPAMRITVTNAGLLGATGVAPLTKLDPGLARAVR